MQKAWTQDQLDTFSTADDIHVSPFYSDGKTPGTPTWIWSVVADGDLYVRAYNGQNSRWYQSAVEQQAGKMSITGKEFDVIYQPVETDAELTQKINDAYTEKYGDSPYLPPMLAEGPVSATVKLLPRESE